jgi:flagellar biosynthesis protein FlhF
MTPALRTQTFRAPDPRSALDAVRAALGDDAVIIGTRQVGGRFNAPEIEITAAVDEPPPDADARDRAIADELGALRRLVEELRARGGEARPGAEPRAAGEGPPDASPLYRRLIQRGLEPGTAEDLVQKARDERRAGEDAAAALRLVVGRRLTVAAPPWEGTGRRVVALVGPTGVGKTTTIAKIAARALLESRQRVTLVTIDNYRIGAREHLARYGELMHVPTYPARDRETLAAALARTADAALVLIDTAGRSDRDAIAAQGALLRSVPGIELHLALSAASGARELRAAARRFVDLAPSRLIFTKLDEAEGPASIYAAALALPRPVSCIADGQRVPDDLHPATTAKLTELVVGPLTRS